MFRYGFNLTFALANYELIFVCVTVSAVRDDFSLRDQLMEYNNDWIMFEKKVLACCDTVLRPYAASSSAISGQFQSSFLVSFCFYV